MYIDLTPIFYVQDVSLENARGYIRLFKEFVFKNGIRKQLQAFKGNTITHIEWDK